MLMFTSFVLMVFAIIWFFIDNFRRRDHHGRTKLGWTVPILFIQLLGALIYIVTRPAEVS